MRRFIESVDEHTKEELIQSVDAVIEQFDLLYTFLENSGLPDTEWKDADCRLTALCNKLIDLKNNVYLS